MSETPPERDGRDAPRWRGGGLAAQAAPTQMAAGLTIMGLGVALLLGRLGILQAHGVWTSLGPLLLIGLGLGRLLTARPDGRRQGGGLLLVGLWLLLNNLHLWRAGESWPLFLVAFGIKLVWDAVMVSAPAGVRWRG